MTKIFLAPCLICTFFVVLWLIKYPSVYFESLMFKDRSSVLDICVNVSGWVFLGGFVVTFIFLAEIITS